ncbi:molecular chaperone HtpG [Pseudoalteromonas sp. S558]|uniref:molecular chaperone HtpG n=1 Tax=Pseudoalteromonas sp. S558 TaxID=2066515 RepID=UPI00110A746D|nr:molecular chaperone HtpG [Pseudoalteromonas sp. S558]TMO05319.1 molecular chaperone HtpG [Pseudoalteromonas sp. S558]
MTTAQKETLGFQTEVKQLLNLMIHSLYSNKEIFLRELVSNSSDAADKLRFLALSQGDLYQGDADLRVRISANKEANTITISDNGIGMTRDEVISSLGTIAKSGTAEFFKNLTGDQSKDSQLIGQFGVGFYSAFIVADLVTVRTRKAGETTAYEWESQGEGEYTLQEIEKEGRGTDIILHLRDEEKEFADDYRLRGIVTKYSDHISTPVQMFKAEVPESEGEDGEKIPSVPGEWESINRATALWTRDKSELSDEEYKEFYKHVSHDWEDPLSWAHNKVEGKTEYTSLLYIPKKAPFDLWNRERQSGLKLYVQRVFVMDDAEQFMPSYLRFVKGLLDSNDLPLNVSREILQDNKVTQAIRKGCTSRIIKMLERMAKNKADDYQVFWNEFGQVMKEGPAEDAANKEAVCKLLRFSSTHTDSETQDVSLEQYVERMNEGQDKIYYVVADTFTSAKNSPHLEIFRKKGIEVLLLSDRVDEWMMSHLTEFSDKQLQSITRGDLDLGKLDDEETKKAQEESEKEMAGLVERIKTALGDDVKEVRFTHRLTDSPACVVSDDNDMSSQMQKLMESVGQAAPEAKPVFELNPDHQLVKHLNDEQDEDKFAQWSHVLLDQALLAERGTLKDPTGFVTRLNKLMLELSK